jgi:hypothetical protein
MTDTEKLIAIIGIVEDRARANELNHLICVGDPNNLISLVVGAQVLYFAAQDLRRMFSSDRLIKDNIRDFRKDLRHKRKDPKNKSCIPAYDFLALLTKDFVSATEKKIKEPTRRLVLFKE